MAGNETLGASFSIDITALKTGLTQANRLIRESNSEFKAAAAGLDDWSDSEEGLKAKIKNLNDVADLQSKKVEALQDAYDDCISKGLDPMSAAAINMRTDLNNEKAALEKTKSETKKYEDALEDVSSESADAGEEVKDLGEKAKETGDGFTIAKGAAADLISEGIQALAGACVDAISSMAGLADETRESRTTFAQLEAAFESAGFSAEDAQKSMTDLYGVLGDTDRAAEASSLIAKMSDDQEDLDKNTRILTGVFAEFGDSIPTEGLAEGMQATAQMGEVQGVLADALEWQGVNLEEYNEKLATMSTEEERASYIQQTLTDLYGASADAYREKNDALIEANETELEHQEILNTLGDIVEPVTTKVKDGFNKILDKILELTENVDFEAFGEKIDSAFDTFINDVLPKVIDGIKWIIDNKDIVIAALAEIAAGFLAFKVAGLITSVVTAIQAAGGALAFLKTSILALPITWISVAIAALVAAIVWLIQNWDKVKEVAEKVWNKIKEIWEKVSTWFMENVIQPVIDFFKGLWEVVSGLFVDLWNDIVGIWVSVATWFNDNVIQPIVNFFKGLWDSVSGFFVDLWNDITGLWYKAATWFYDNVTKPIIDFFKGLWDSVSGFFVDLWNDITGLWYKAATWFYENVTKPVIDFFKGLWDSVSGFFVNLWNDITGLWYKAATWFYENVTKPIIDFFKGLWDSVSGFFKNLWSDIKGIWSSVSGWFKSSVIEPITNFFSDLWQSLKDKAKDAWEGIKGVFSKVGDFFGGIWDTIKEKFSTIGTKVAEAIGGAFKSAINAVISVVEGGLNLIPKAINGAIGLINKLPGVNIKKMNLISLPRLAKGGVVNSATGAIIGEDGAEAIVPLERNTEWIDRVANRLAEKEPRSVVVNQTNNYTQAHSRYEIYKSRQQTAAAVRLALQGV